MTDCDCSCDTFIITGSSYTITLFKPQWGGEQYALRKELQAFNFWSTNFSIHDKGIDSEPIILAGVETIGKGDCSYGIFCIPPCIPLCLTQVFTDKFIHMREMANNNEEVEISGLGTCIDAVYIIRSFNTKTLKAPLSRSWVLTLEYVRDL